MEELAADPRRRTGTAAHRAARQEEHRSPEAIKYTGIRQVGPESLRHFKRTFKEALKRQITSGTYDPMNPSSCRSARTSSIASWKRIQKPESIAVIIYMMDVSGSMTDEQKEIVRIEAFWIDTWIKTHYQGVETRYIIHDAAAQEVDEHTFYHTRESGGTKISSAYELCDKIIDDALPAGPVEHLRLPLLRRRQLGRRHTDVASRSLNEKLLPKVNLFGYGQVESPTAAASSSANLEDSIHENR